ncbi:MAG: hypothetical protein OXR73_02270 [Myxococcales bacterium]|nr:hypothetical protein [Myxococcales bacterium]
MKKAIRLRLAATSLMGLAALFMASNVADAEWGSYAGFPDETNVTTSIARVGSAVAFSNGVLRSGGKAIDVGCSGGSCSPAKTATGYCWKYNASTGQLTLLNGTNPTTGGSTTTTCTSMANLHAVFLKP